MPNAPSQNSPYKGTLIAILVGLFSLWVNGLIDNPVMDPLVTAMAIGIFARLLIKFDKNYTRAFLKTPGYFMILNGIRTDGKYLTGPWKNPTMSAAI